MAICNSNQTSIFHSIKEKLCTKISERTLFISSTDVATKPYLQERQSTKRNNTICYIKKFKNFTLKLSIPTTLKNTEFDWFQLLSLLFKSEIPCINSITNFLGSTYSRSPLLPLFWTGKLSQSWQIKWIKNQIQIYFKNAIRKQQ